MEQYKAKKWSIPELGGISKKQIEEHLKLYQGYVNHVNLIQEEAEKLHELDTPGDHYAVSELWRRLAFEFNGMRSHEYYFGALDGGARPFDRASVLGKALLDQYGSYEDLHKVFSSVAKTRGSGWAMLYYDSVIRKFVIGWIDEHHIGYLSSLPLVLALDCWEHAYMVDYLPGERGKYVDAYLNNVNWEVVNSWFEKV